MRTLAVATTILAVLAASACVVTRSGTLRRIPTGRVIPVEVSVTSEEAFVRGTDPDTGEKLEGTLTLDRESRRGALTPPRAPVPVGGGAGPGGAGVGVPIARDTVLNFTGTLDGDRGTSLSCTLQVQKRIRLQGLGSCRQLVAGQEVVYRLVF